MSSVAENLERVRERFQHAVSRAGLSAGEVELMAVSKTFPPERIAEAVACGQTLFGENKVQELLAKKPLLPERLRWHLIGHLQSNKVRKVLAAADVIHSVGSVDLARDIQRIAAELGLFPKIYLEVNVAAESSKHGFTPDALPRELDTLLAMDRLEIQGLMCIPPFDPEPENTRRHFAFLRTFRDQLSAASGIPLTGLSMGMSHDFEVAIAEGSTVVRVGSAIFGGR
jgi:PLP dependent protein